MNLCTIFLSIKNIYKKILSKNERNVNKVKIICMF